MEDLIKMRDLFRESADIIDEMIEIDKREQAGEDVKKELEAISGRFLFKMMEIQGLK